LTRSFAARGHRVVGLLTSPRRDPQYAKVVSDAAPDVDVIVSQHPKRWASMLAPLRPDLLVSAIFPHRLPADVLALPRLGAVNFHPTLLPAYRGTDTPFWLLRNGERQWGITLHRMSAEFDTGPILAQEAFEISDDDTLTTLFPRLGALLQPLLDVGLARIAAGDPGDPQDESRASYYGAIPDLDAWRRLDWSLPAREAHNIVRSCDGLWGGSGAHAMLDGAPVTILRTRLVPADEAPPTHAAPGAVLSRDADGLLVQCGDGPLRVVEHAPRDAAEA
jgi:methionyl-tRNA formyltransferase